jgi:beta-lactamase class A
LRKLRATHLMRLFLVLSFLYFLSLLNVPLHAQPQDDLRGKLSAELERLAADFDGRMGIAVKDLTTGEAIRVNADVVFPQASSIKIPILIELYRQAQAGTLRLDERVEITRAQMAGGSGVLQQFSDGHSALSLRDIAVLMIVLSDNSATNILIERVGMARVNELLRRAGLPETKLQRVMMDTAAQREARENLSTPAEMAALLEMLHGGKLLDAAHTAAVLEILAYPKSSALRRGLPAAVQLANKPGGIPGVVCDSGIVLLEGRPYVIAVMTSFAADTGAADRAVSEVSRRVFTYFERLARSSPHGVRLP